MLQSMLLYNGEHFSVCTPFHWRLKRGEFERGGLSESHQEPEEYRLNCGLARAALNVPMWTLGKHSRVRKEQQTQKYPQGQINLRMPSILSKSHTTA
jgi:hypothetical protein